MQRGQNTNNKKTKKQQEKECDTYMKEYELLTGTINKHTEADLLLLSEFR